MRGSFERLALLWMTVARKEKDLGPPQDLQLEKAVFTWFNQARSEGTPISGPVIQAQAKTLNEDLRGEGSDFGVTTSWLKRFKGRHGISQVTIRGEQRSADLDAAESYPVELRRLLQEGGYNEEQVYNCDETGLYFKMLPDKTLATKTDTNRTLGFKQHGQGALRT